MKSVLRSVKPYWVYLILTGKKTIEVGKDRPKSEDWNRKVEMYCSKDMRSFNRIPEADRGWMRKYLGKVACQFVCDKISRYGDYDGNTDSPYFITPDKLRQTCLTFVELEKYGRNDIVYGWHISDLVIYDKPRELSEFKHICPYTVPNCEACKYSINEELPFGKLSVGCDKRLTRPFRSWGYVEE